MSDIPHARAKLRILADRLARLEHEDLAEKIISEILPLLTRRHMARPRTRVKSAPMDASLADRIRKAARLYPHWSVQDLAEHFDVNPGRVSEALHGDR